MFCEECINKNIEQRVRACPLCRKKLSRNDVNKIYWGEGDE